MLRFVACAAHWCGRTMGPRASLLPASPGAETRLGAGGSGGAGGGVAGALSAYCRDDAAIRRLPPLRSSAGASCAATFERCWCSDSRPHANSAKALISSDRGSTGGRAGFAVPQMRAPVQVHNALSSTQRVTGRAASATSLSRAMSAGRPPSKTAQGAPQRATTRRAPPDSRAHSIQLGRGACHAPCPRAGHRQRCRARCPGPARARRVRGPRSTRPRAGVRWRGGPAPRPRPAPCATAVRRERPGLWRQLTAACRQRRCCGRSAGVC
jgi:hypothetical protein